MDKNLVLGTVLNIFTFLLFSHYLLGKMILYYKLVKIGGNYSIYRRYYDVEIDVK